jgi:PPK2 family polyphosphate:nucleotide phosphotransferase
MNVENLNTSQFKAIPNQEFYLKGHDPAFCDRLTDKTLAKQALQTDIDLMKDLQYQLYAENKQALLVIFQAMDAAGKDSAIRHVFGRINPQGCEVHSFKQPSDNELEHDYLWRHYVKLPERGKIGIFNRSHYENVLITQVHPEYILKENLPGIESLADITEEFWEKRYRQINQFEKTVVENGTTIIKFFLHLSKEKQKKRFLKRIDNKEKNWKFSAGDIKERSYWDEYQKVYEKALALTSTEIAPWFIIPADHKWFTHAAIARIVLETLKNMDIKMPVLPKNEMNDLEKAKEKLMKE